MRTIYLGTLKIHDITDPTIGYAVSSPIKGVNFPGIRNTSYPKPGEHGAYLSQSLYDSRLIHLEGAVWASDITSYEARRRALEAIVKISRDTNLVPQPITFKGTTTDSLAIQADGYIQTFELDIVNVLGSKFLIELFCPDFALYSQNAQLSTLTVASGGGSVYPFIYPEIYGGSTGGSSNTINNGNCESFPVITLNGSLTNPIIQNNTNGRYLALNMTLGAMDQVVIDMRNKTIILNGVTSVIGNKTDGSQWWWLEAGSNILQFITGNSGDTGNCQVSYRDAYIGV